jgi:hypothetical protein
MPAFDEGVVMLCLPIRSRASLVIYAAVMNVGASGALRHSRGVTP